MAFVETRDGVRLYAKDWGAGPPIVLIHGWPLNADMWDYVGNELVDRGFRVVAYDRRGFGRSDQPGSGYDYDTLSDDLAAVMSACGLSDATLVGFSMGGGEVARYMSRHRGENVGKTMLVSSVVPYLLKDESNSDGIDGSTFEEFKSELKADRPAFLSTFGKQFYGVGLLERRVSSDYLEWTQSLALMGSLRATLACVDAFGRTDFRGDTEAFRVPTLIIHGTGDKIVPFEMSGKRASQLIVGAELKTYEGAPHGLHYTEQERLVEDIAAFVRG